MEGVAKLVNSTPRKECSIPYTKHKIKKTIKPLLNTEFYIKCISCNAYTATTNAEIKCTTTSCQRLVNRANSPYFVNFPLRVQLTKSIKENFDTIMSYNDYMNEASESFRDIHDGIVYKKMKD